MIRLNPALILWSYHDSMILRSCHLLILCSYDPAFRRFYDSVLVWTYDSVMSNDLMILWSYDPMTLESFDTLILLISFVIRCSYDPVDPVLVLWSHDPVDRFIFIWFYNPFWFDDPVILQIIMDPYLDPMIVRSYSERKPLFFLQLGLRSFTAGLRAIKPRGVREK